MKKDNFIDNISAEGDRLPGLAQQVDYLLLRLDLLEPQDRTLMVMRFRHGISCWRLARMAGLCTNHVLRRTDALAQRLMGREYVTVLRNKERFSTLDLEVAYDRYLLGYGYRRISSKRHIGQAEARRIVGNLDRWLVKRLKEKQKKPKPVIFRGKVK